MYPNLRAFGWALGVQPAPKGYQHPWLLVLKDRTEGYYTRAEARKAKDYGMDP